MNVLDSFRCCVTSSRSEYPTATDSHEGFEGFVGIAGHVESPVECKFHFFGCGDQFCCADFVYSSVGSEYSRYHTICSAVMGKTNFFEHLVKFFVGVEEVSATGTNHYTQFQMRNSTSHANECGRWGSASLIRRCTQFYTGDTHIGGYLAGFECESAKFGFYHDYRFSKLCIEFSFSKDFTKIVKGECRDKRKYCIRFGYA